MSEPVWIIGINMTKFGKLPDDDLLDLASMAATAAIADAGVSMADLGVLAVGNQFEPLTDVGQRLQKQIGQTGIPVYNVANACATGASALRIAHMAIKSGEVDLGLAVGVEKMTGGMPAPFRAPRKNEDGKQTWEPEGRNGQVMGTDGILGSGFMAAVFAQAGMEYADQWGVSFEQFAKVAEKNHAHSTLNPLAQFRQRYALDEIMNAPMMSYPNTLLMCCPTGDGAAAAVLVSDERLRSLPVEVQRRAVRISAAALTTDPFVEGLDQQPDVNTLTRNAASAAYEQAGVGPEDLDLVELHDCFATAELVHYDNLGLCEPGGAGAFIDAGGPWRDGTTPVNVSGGLISKGHPIGATGVAGVFEVATHLRGEAGDRQIDGASVGMAHVIGLGSTCAIHILERSGR